MYILIALLVFGFLIFIHELGHYIAARLTKVRIFEFAIGMGPKLLWYESKKTGIVYSLRMIPIGGFVSMDGELATGENSQPEDEEIRALRARTASQVGATSLGIKPAWQRLIVHVAGATMNLIFGFLAAIILTCVLQVGGTTVAEFVPAEGKDVAYTQSQGLAVGDEIVAVNGKRVYIADQLFYEIMHEGGTDEPLTLTVVRDGVKQDLTIHFPTLTEQGQSFGDYDFLVYGEKKTFGVVIKQSFHKSCYMVNMVWDSLIDLITGRYSFEAVSGPIGTTTVIADAAKMGWQNLFFLMALISVNLGIFNLLPLPALDGGHIFYTLIELVTRRRLPEKVVGILDSVGLILLMGLMVVVALKDIFALF